MFNLHLCSIINVLINFWTTLHFIFPLPVSNFIFIMCFCFFILFTDFTIVILCTNVEIEPFKTFSKSVTVSFSISRPFLSSSISNSISPSLLSLPLSSSLSHSLSLSLTLSPCFALLTLLNIVTTPLFIPHYLSHPLPLSPPSLFSLTNDM